MINTLISPPVALAYGIVVALVMGQPFPAFTNKATKYLLQWSVAGLGFGMNLGDVWAAGSTGFVFTVATIAGTLLLGWLLGRVLQVNNQTSCLISSGTAICGGSAIAAVGAVLNADKKAISVALAAIFSLNALALFIFPPIGKMLGMSQEQFGLWAAIAIHDTSSVVGAAAKYGDIALQFATTVKLTRALWIIPLVLVISFFVRHKSRKVIIPWFILFFVMAAAVRTIFPRGECGYLLIRQAAKVGLTFTLFLIGTGFSREAVRSIGVRAMIQSIVLWLIVSVSSLFAVLTIIHRQGI
jgi:uncharacterized integral membrane protein (TIGR00698 family)